MTACAATQPPTVELPFTEDFSNCDKWSTNDTDKVSLACEDGQYHFVVKSQDPQSADIALSKAADRITVSVDANPLDFDRLNAVGLGCWQGTEADSPGYRAVIGPQGWNILKDQADGPESLPFEESGLDWSAEGDAFQLRAECLAGSAETTVKLYVDGTLVGTGTDAQGVGGFENVGILVVGESPPVAVNFDNFKVESR